LKLTDQLASYERRGTRLTKAAGWIAIAFGAVHVVVASLDTHDIWSEVVADGWWNAFTLDTATTLAQLARSEAFWLTLGSFGVPVLVLGCHLVWSARRGQRVPGWIGWIVLAWGLLTVTALPASPAWALAVCGGLIVLGDRRRSRTRLPRGDRPDGARAGGDAAHGPSGLVAPGVDRAGAAADRG
jgi:hypothetical protein